MQNTTYLLPGDTLTADKQSYHFTKEKTYTISKSFIHNGEVLHFIKDDYGIDVPMHKFGFQTTGKTHKLVEQRRIKARLDFFWKNRIEHFVDSQNIFDRTKTFILSFAHFLNNPDAIASIDIHSIIAPGTAGPDGTIIDRPRYWPVRDAYTYFYKESDFYEYFEKYFNVSLTKSSDFDAMKRRLSLPGAYIDAMDAIDKSSYIRFCNLPYFTVDAIITHQKYLLEPLFRKTKLSWSEYLMEISKFVFRKPNIELDIEKQVLIDILDLFVILPGSYGSTAITKILNGTGKIKNKKVEEYKGKYKGIYSYAQLFELADGINNYMHSNDIFNTKEDYCSGDEWRGQFEYIGNASVDVKKVIEFKETLTNL